jgi:hypothetical protein
MAKVTGTREAFSIMIQERGVYKKLEVDRSTVANWKIYLKIGAKISIDKMEEMLRKYGAVQVREAVWEV